MIGARSLSARLMISLLSALWLGAGPIVFAVNVLNLEGLHGLKLWEWPGLRFERDRRACDRINRAHLRRKT